MPSLSHRVVSFAIPRLRPRTEIRDVEKFRNALIEKNRTRATTPPNWVRRSHTISAIDIGFPAWVLTPKSHDWTHTLVHVHGGSFCAPAAAQQWRWALKLAERTNARVVFPAYPLAPEFTWRDSHEPLVKLMTELMADGPVALSGDSAGGGMALAVAEALRDRGGVQPTHLLLLAPWIDLTGSAPGFEEAAARDPWLSYDNHDDYALFWAGREEDLGRFEVSPALGDLTGLPRTLVFCGTHDMLYAGCVALGKRAKEASWNFELVVGHGMLHVYPLLPIAEARPAFRKALAFLRS